MDILFDRKHFGIELFSYRYLKLCNSRLTANWKILKNVTILVDFDPLTY